MKKIGKIQINPEKVMNNEELLQLRGGYDGDSNCGVSCSTNQTCENLPGPCKKCHETAGGWPRPMCAEF